MLYHMSQLVHLNAAWSAKESWCDKTCFVTEYVLVVTYTYRDSPLLPLENHQRPSNLE